MKKTKLIALILAVLTVLSSSVVAFAADDAADLVKVENAERLGVNAAIKALRNSAVKDGYYKADDKVTVIIELDGSTLVDAAGSDVAEYAATAKGEKKNASILKNQEKLKKQLSERYDISFEGSVNYTATLNAFTAVISYGDLNKIANFRGVKNAFVSGTYAMPKAEVAEPNLIGVDDMVSAGAVNGTNYTGEGIVVAVLDTGLVYDHEAFAVEPKNPAVSVSKMQRLVRGYRDELNSAGEAAVISEKVIYAYDYIDGDNDVYPGEGAGDHGTHVAGIIAGNNGSDFTGIAPDAQLMIMKVFSDNGGGAPTYTLLAAIEDAVLLGADVINMSLGSPAGFTSSADETINAVYDSVAEAGVVLCCSAGNEAQQASYIAPYDLPYAATPDYGLVGSPSTFAAALSVASAENIYIVREYMTVAGEIHLTYTENEPIVPVSTIYGQEFEYVFCGLGYPEEIVDVEGKVALISRGELSFEEKVNNAAAKGAAAVIVMNTDNETIGMVIENATIPAVSITYDQGVAMLNAEVKTVVFSDEPGAFLNGLGGTMSDFSSWGCTPDLQIKPEITAPGGYIYSATYDNGYILMSGTSMSCPAVAGSAAVMLQYLYKYNRGLEKTDAAEAVINRFMSTADILVDPNTGSYYSPRRQGSGIVNIIDAITTRSYITVDGGRPKASAGSSESGVFKYTFEVNNTTNKNELYYLDTTALVDAPTSDGVDLYSALVSLELEEGVDYEISYSAKNGRITDKREKDGTVAVAVPAKDVTKVTVSIKLYAETKAFLDMYFENGTYVEGYTTLAPRYDTELVVPFIGFYGDWASLPIFDGTVYDGNAFYYESAMMVYNEYDKDGDFVVDTAEGYNLGYNFITGEYDAENLAYSPYYINNYSGTPIFSYLSSDTGYLRNANDVHYTIRDEDGKIVAEYDDYYGNVNKSYYNYNYDYIVSNYDYAGVVGAYDSTELPEGNYSYTITGTSGGGKEQSVTYDFYVDNTAPQIGDYYYEDSIYAFTAIDDRALQGVQLLTFVNVGGRMLLGISALEIIEYTVLLYDLGYITYDQAMALLTYAPTYIGDETDEDGVMATYYDLTNYEAFAEVFNATIAPVLFGEGVTLVPEYVAVGALDYACNVDGYYAVPVE